MPNRRAVRAPWTNKFERPSIEELRGSMPRESAVVFDALRERMLACGDLTETLTWQGVPWRWTLVYGARGEIDGRAWAYVIPDPAGVQICVTLTSEQIRAMDVRRLKKWVRDGIAFARSVGGVCWPTYPVGSRTQVEEVMELVERKARVGGAAAMQAVSA